MNNHKFSFLHRFLHWSIALCILFILLTVFLRMDWMNKKNIAEIIIQNLQAKDISISQKDAESIAKNIRKPMWNWHLYIGYAVSVLYIIRVIYIFLKGSNFRNPFSKEIILKQKLQSAIYILFYTILGITLISGILIENGSRDYKSFLIPIHKSSLFFMMIFLLLHFIGIFIAEKTTEKGIVSSMINGDNH